MLSKDYNMLHIRGDEPLIFAFSGINCAAMDMTKTAVRKALGMTDSRLANYLGVTRSAICQWPDDEPIPMPRQWQLKALRPDLFQAQSERPADQLKAA